MKKVLLAVIFGISLFGISNAQPGAAQKAAVKEWHVEKFEVGWDRGPVLKGSFQRDKDVSCEAKNDNEKRDRTRPERAEKPDRTRPERSEKPEKSDRSDRTRPEREDRVSREPRGFRVDRN